MSVRKKEESIMLLGEISALHVETHQKEVEVVIVWYAPIKRK
jgi:hypothetical protein